MGILYRPDDGVAADFIPFYWRGNYHLFYLKDYRDPDGHGEGTPWFHLVTRDFVHFRDWGEALPRGKPNAQDLWVFTGSVIHHEDLFHIYYTGHNSHFREANKPVQAVMHATSPDLRTWAKDDAFDFFAPTDLGYEPNDWRDPHVFWNDEAGEYQMLLAARKTHGPDRHRGCIALAGSPDLAAWSVRDPFWAPDLYYTHECPDVFRIGRWWYLVYSTFSERCVTHYRMARTLQGPWLAPANDTFDGRAYYAAKTAGTPGHWYSFGWLPTRVGEKDDGDWQWGGNLVVHEIAQRPDGTLVVHAPDTVLEAFGQRVELCPKVELGSWQATTHGWRSDAQSRFSALTLGALPEECLCKTAISYAEGTASFGLLLRAQEKLEAYYQVRLEPAAQRIVVDRWPRPGDQPFMLERPLTMLPDRPITLRLIIDGTCLVVYADDEVALSCRIYAHRRGALGLFVSEGAACFKVRNIHEAQGTLEMSLHRDDHTC